MRFVSVKNIAQQDLQAMHRVRASLVEQRTAKGNQSRWVTRLASRAHPNVTCVAMANKTARMAWAMLRHGTNYQPALAAA